MAVNKHFVVKNGIEVAEDLIYASGAVEKVGIGSTLPTTTLEVGGQGIKAQDGNFTGIVTAFEKLLVGSGGTFFNVYTDTGLVGVGTSSAFTLHVENTTDDPIALRVGGGGADIDGDVDGQFARFEAINVTGLSTFGDTTFTGSIDGTGDFDFSGEIIIGGGASIGGGLTVGGGVTVGGDLQVGGAVTLTGRLEVDSNVSISGDILVSGVGTIGSLDVNGSLDVSNTLDVTSDTTIGGGLTVSGGDLNITNGDVNISGALTASSLLVTGITTLESNNIYSRINVVNDGSSAYNLTGAGFTQPTANPDLNIIRGKKYEFHVNAPGHPFYLKTTASTGTGDTYDDGVLGNGIEVGIVTLAVTQKAPAVIYYQCANHVSMGSSIQIISQGGASEFNSLGIQSAGLYIGNARTLNFVGAGNSLIAQPDGETIDIQISGGGGGGLGTAVNYDNTSLSSPFAYIDKSVTVTQDVTLDDLNSGDQPNNFVVVNEPILKIGVGSSVSVGVGKTLIIDSIRLSDYGAEQPDLERGQLVYSAEIENLVVGTSTITKCEVQGELTVGSITNIPSVGFIENLGNYNGTTGTFSGLVGVNALSATTGVVIGAGTTLSYDSTNNRLSVNTGIAATGNIHCVELFQSSDMVLKRDISPVSHALETINELTGVDFTWNSNDQRSKGVLAQDVESVLPELVSSFNGTKSVNYNGIVGVLIEAVKQLSQEVEDLKSLLDR